MDFLVFLLGIVLTAAIFSAVQLIKGYRQLTNKPNNLRAISPPQPQPAAKAAARIKHELRTISITECETLRRCSSDSVVFVSIGQTAKQVKLPFYKMDVLTMTPSQFVCEVRWFPPDTCVVLYGNADVCSSVVASLQHALGIPPLFFLRDASVERRIA